MSLTFPNGAVFGFSTAIGAAIAASAVSNADPAVATVATGAVDADDVLVMQSSWSLANNAVAEAGTVTTGATDTVQLLGLDSTDTELYPAAGASMTLMKASGFVDFSQQGDPSTSGGDQNFWTGQFLEDRSGRQINVPTFKSAMTLTLPVYFDKSAPWFAAAKLADAKRQPIVLRCTLPDGAKLYRYGYLSFNSDPSIAANNPMGNTVTFNAMGETTIVEAA
jgi:hypothetical protein